MEIWLAELGDSEGTQIISVHATKEGAEKATDTYALKENELWKIHSWYVPYVHQGEDSLIRWKADGEDLYVYSLELLP